MSNHLAGEHAQRFAPLIIESPGFLVDDAKRAQGVTGCGDEGRTGIEADAEIARNQRVVRKAIVAGGILHHHERIRL